MMTMNLAGFLVICNDKSLAIQQQSRISELRLLACIFIGKYCAILHIVICYLIMPLYGTAKKVNSITFLTWWCGQLWPDNTYILAYGLIFFQAVVDNLAPIGSCFGCLVSRHKTSKKEFMTRAQLVVTFRLLLTGVYIAYWIALLVAGYLLHTVTTISPDTIDKR